MMIVYDGGRYFVMMWNSFKYFPRTAKNIEFSNRPSAISKPMETRTNDGLGLTLHVSFQY
jgi:hypothetical protein